MTKVRFQAALLALLPSLLVLGCDAKFPEYNELEGFRVLALRASSPAVHAGDTVSLDALVFLDSGSLDDVTFAWSWCPLRLPSSEGGDCATDERGFEQALGLPAGSLDFDLGTNPEAQLKVPGVAAIYEAACTNGSGGGKSSDKAFVFACDGGFPISIRADISHQGQTIQAEKDVVVVYDATIALNQNPMLGALSYRETSVATRVLTPWADGKRPAFRLGKTYHIESAVAESTAETFQPAPTAVTPHPSPRRESLYITWFITTGKTKSRRSTYIDGSVDIQTLRENEWTLPKARDEKKRAASLFLVLRDERGGVDWLEGGLELKP
jgi:hypothetical protein